MKFSDLFRLIFGNINRRKGRVALTAIGVVIGSAAMLILISLGEGITRGMRTQLTGSADLTQIQVLPPIALQGDELTGMGTPTGSKASTNNRPKLITNRALEDLRAITDVEAVYPYQELLIPWPAIQYNNLEAHLSLVSIGEIEDLAAIGLVANQGTTGLEKGTVIIGSSVAEEFNNPNPRAGTKAPTPDLFEQTLKIIFSKTDSDGNKIYKTLFYRVTGIVESRDDGVSDWYLYVPLDEIKTINEWAGGKLIDYDKDGYSRAIVKVNDITKVLSVVDKIKNNFGFKVDSPMETLRVLNNILVLLQIGFGFIGAVVLLVAAIGIANTMTTAIQERTAEIGLMKAVGATNSTVLAIFLGEAASIGFVGGLGGIIIGWLAGQGLNEIALIYLAVKAQDGSQPLDIAILTPLWLPGFILLFSTAIGIVSGLLPAMRAANMTPVDALKHE